MTVATSATPIERPALVTIREVEIMSVGTWTAAIGGTRTITEADLASAVAAYDDPGVPTPRIKIGHTDPRFTDPTFGADGQPALGKATGLRLSADNQTLIGDFEGIPSWFADIMASAYPARSAEGYFNFHSEATERDYGFAVVAVSLLGVTMPAISCLADIETLYSAAGPEVVLINTREVEPMAAAKGGKTARIAASVNIEDVRREYYDSLTGDQYYWWIRAMYLDPNELIVSDDDEGTLYRVPFSVNTDGNTTFGEPTQVVVEYADVPKEQMAAGRMLKLAAAYATRSDSRPETNNQEDDMDPSKIRSALGLGADATEEQVLAKAAELATAPKPTDEAKDTDKDTEEATDDPTGSAGEPSETTTATTPAVDAVAASSGASGTVTMDAETLADLRRNAELGAAARRQQLDAERETLLSGAVGAGKFPPARVDHYRTAYNADPEGTRALINSLAEGLVPVTEAQGSANTNDDTTFGAGSAYPDSWLTAAEREAVAARKGA